MNVSRKPLRNIKLIYVCYYITTVKIILNQLHSPKRLQNVFSKCRWFLHNEIMQLHYFVANLSRFVFAVDTSLLHADI